MLKNINKPAMFGENDLQAAIQDVLAPEISTILRQNFSIASLIYVDKESGAVEKGDKVKVLLPVEFGEAKDFIKGVGIDNSDIVVNSVEIVVDQYKGFEFGLSDKEILEMKTSLVLPSSIEAATKSLAKTIDTYIYKTAYIDVPFVSGSDAAAAFDVKVIANANKVLFDNEAGERPLYLTLNSTRYNELSDDLVTKNNNLETGSMAMRKLWVGEVAGFNVFRDSKLMNLRHTSGTANLLSDGDLVVKNSVLKGATSVDFKASNVATDVTLKAGDIVQITLDNGNIQSNCVKADSSFASGINFGTVELVYPLEDAASATNLVIVPVKSASYDVNIGFASDFYALVVRPLVTAAQMFGNTGAIIVEQYDAISGLSYKLEMYRDSKTGENKFRIEALYGGKVVRKELATRVLGS